MNHLQINIGEAAKRSGVSARMIRHYERIGLLPAAARTGSGYRTYDGHDVHTLRFVHHARTLGFSVRQIEELLSLWRSQERPSSKVKALALAHIAELDVRIRDLHAMKQALEHLAGHCRGDERPECPILDGIAEAPTKGVDNSGSRDGAVKRSYRKAGESRARGGGLPQ